jgi:hypothetical protein
MLSNEKKLVQAGLLIAIWSQREQCSYSQGGFIVLLFLLTKDTYCHGQSQALKTH